MQRTSTSTDALEASLTRTLGPVLGGAQLTKALGYPTQSAFRRTVARGAVPIPVFTISGRRGRFALTRDVAAWLISIRDAKTREGGQTD